jgi:NAD(P)-dependent dehydrogenase (short-subunit alcohol dehydrogenase family)
MKPVCLIIGAGAGIGGNVGRRFAREGYHAVLCRRSNRDGLDRMVADIREAGDSATGFLINAIETDRSRCKDHSRAGNRASVRHTEACE